MAILAICVVAMGWRNHLLLEAAIKKIRDAGDPVTTADLERKGIAPLENAATYLALISTDTMQLSREIYPSSDLEEFSWTTGLSEARRDRIKNGFELHPKFLEMLTNISTCNVYAPTLNYSLPPTPFLESMLGHCQTFREYVRVLNFYGQYLASIGEPDKAVGIYLIILRLSELQSQDPLLVASLVNFACRGIAIGGLNGIMQTSKLSEETHQAIEIELANQHPLDSFAQMLKTERAYGIDSFRSQFSSTLMAWYIGDYLDCINSWIANGSNAHFESTNKKPREGSVFGSLVQPALEAASSATNRVEASLRCLRILNAIHAATDDGKTIDIKSLQLPANVMIDPFNGKPLTIERTPNGWLVYSVGSNGRDDGGTLKEYADIGMGPVERMPD